MTEASRKLPERSCPSPAVIARALRLPFTAASVLPYLAGSLLSAESSFHPVRFVLGLGAVVFTHLSANAINDYADSKSGADWQDTRWYHGIFGGSKLIQEGRLSERFYYGTAVLLGGLAAVSVLALCLWIGTGTPFLFYVLVLALAWAYSQPPLKLSYRRLGEAAVFVLFGPVATMGGRYIQTGVFPDVSGLLLSLPFGFLTTAILFVNEVPDFAGDQAAGKDTWVAANGQRRAYLP